MLLSCLISYCEKCLKDSPAQIFQREYTYAEVKYKKVSNTAEGTKIKD